jgi:dolichol kinase
MLTDEAAIVAAKLAGSNLWLSYLTLPVEVALFLWMLSVLQPTEYLRTAYILSIPVVGILVVALLVLTDPSRTFDRFVAPALALITLAASLHTLVLRSLESRAPLTQQDWFWLCLGLSLFWLSFVSITIFLEAFVGSHPEWVLTALIARSWVDIAAYCLMAWGLLQPWLRARSFGSS